LVWKAYFLKANLFFVGSGLPPPRKLVFQVQTCHLYFFV
jgi:hypothetical protein